MIRSVTILLALLLSGSSCSLKQDERIVFSKDAEPCLVGEKVLAISQANELYLMDEHSRKKIAAFSTPIRFLYIINDKEFVVGINERKHKKALFRMSMTGDTIWRNETYEGRFFNSYIENDTLWFLSAKRSSVDLSNGNSQSEVLGGEKELSIQELLKLVDLGKGVFLRNLFFEPKDAIGVLQKNYPNVANFIDESLVHLRRINKGFCLFSRQKNGKLFIQVVPNNSDAHITFYSSIDHSEQKIEEDYISVYNLSELEIFSIKENKRILKFKSSQLFLVETFVTEHEILFLTRDKLIKVPINEGLESAVKKKLKEYSVEVVDS